MDCSMALIQASSKAFNNMTILQYLKFVWTKVNHDNGKIESILNISVIHICSSHLINAGRKRIKVFTTEDIGRHYQGFILTSLIHSTDLISAANIVICATIFFCSERKIPEFYNALSFIKNLTDIGEAEECTERVTELSPDLESGERVFPSSQREQSPFYVYFEHIIRGCLNTLEEKDNPDFSKKEFFSPLFLTYLQNEILPMFPLISGLIIHLFGIKRDTNNAVENWFGFVKNVVFAKDLKQLIPRFIQRHELSMDGRFKEVLYGLTTTRQLEGRANKRKKEAEDPIVEEAMSEVQSARQETDCELDEIVGIVSQKTSTAVTESSQQNVKPWTGEKFPMNLEKKELVRFGVTLDDVSLRSLLRHQCVDNYVINAFMSFLAAKYEDISLLNFPVEYTKILTSTVENDSSIIKWCQKMRANKYDAWLLPVHDTEVHNTGHWTLFLVVFSQKCLIYFDSLHDWPKNYWVSRICSLIERLFPNMKTGLLNWSEWTLFAPADVPKQGGASKSSNNCGLHVCVWNYILYSGELNKFDESEMYSIRPWIMSSLLNTKLTKCSKGLIFPTSENFTVLQQTDISKMARSRNPPSHFDSTLEYTASLKAILQATHL